MFLVIWTPYSQKQLRDMIDNATDAERPAIIRAARKIDDALRREGPQAGESRVKRFRVLIEPPLVATFWVGFDEYMDTITVIRIRLRSA